MRQDERVGMQSTQLAQQKQQAEANRQMREELAKQHQQQGAQNQQQMTMARNAGIELRMSQQFQHQIREEDATLAATQKLEQLAPSMVGRNLNSIEQQTVAVLLQKFLDPASVVREGEYGRAALAMGFVDRAQMYYDSIMKGALLSPRMVNDIISMSKMYTKSASGKIQKIGDQYAQIAKRRGLDPENVITSPYYTWPGTPGSAPAADIKVIPKSGAAPAPQTDRRQGNRYQVDY
jgi:hypothetical protein